MALTEANGLWWLIVLNFVFEKIQRTRREFEWLCIVRLAAVPVFAYTETNNKQLLDEVEQNIVICQLRADQLFADAEGRGK